ncbi:MAG: hypothetical protein AB8C84_07710 [Oligoflexales bacterium]
MRMLSLLMLLSFPCYAQSLFCEDPYWPSPKKNPIYLEKTKNFKGILVSKCTVSDELKSENQVMDLLRYLYTSESEITTVLSGPEETNYKEKGQTYPALFYKIKQLTETKHGKLDILYHAWLIPGASPQFIARSIKLDGSGHAKYTSSIHVRTVFSKNNDDIWEFSYKRILQVRKPFIAPRSIFMERVQESFYNSFIEDRNLMVENIEEYLSL